MADTSPVLDPGIRRRVSESWRAAARRIAMRAGMEDEVLAAYARRVARGVNEEEAAVYALIECGCAEMLEGDGDDGR